MTKKDTSLDDIAESISALASMVSEKFDEVDTRLDSNDKRLESVGSRFDAMDKRFDAMDKRFDAMDKRFDAMDKRFDRVDATLAEHTGQIRDLQVSSIKTVDKLDDIEGRLLALEEDIKEIYMMLDKHVLGKKLTSIHGKNLEQQVIEAYQNILQIAKEANIKLPM